MFLWKKERRCILSRRKENKTLSTWIYQRKDGKYFSLRLISPSSVRFEKRQHKFRRVLMLNIFFRERGCIFSPSLPLHPQLLLPSQRSLRLMNIITARYDLCAPLENSAPRSQSRSRTSVTNVGSTKTRRKVTSENGCRQASMSESYFNDIFSCFSQPAYSPEVACPGRKWLPAIFTQTPLWTLLAKKEFVSPATHPQKWIYAARLLLNKIKHQTK